MHMRCRTETTQRLEVGGTAVGGDAPCAPHVTVHRVGDVSGVLAEIADGVRRAVWRDLSPISARTVRAELPPDARAAQAARHVVGRACLGWGYARHAATAAALAAEMAISSVAAGAEDLEVSVSSDGPLLRMAVRDGVARTATPSDGLPAFVPPTRLARMAAAAGDLVRSCGVVPVTGGQLAWAVLANPRASPASHA